MTSRRARAVPSERRTTALPVHLSGWIKAQDREASSSRSCGQTALRPARQHSRYESAGAWRALGQGRVSTPFAYESTSTTAVGLPSVAGPPTPSMTESRPPDWLGVQQVPFTEQVLEMNRSMASVNTTPGALGAS